MKKILIMFVCAVIFTTHAFTQDQFDEESTGLKISGEIKTGLFWFEKQVGGADVTSEGYIHNSQDDSTAELLLNPANKSQGRFRLNLQYDYGLIGMKTRFQQTEWRDSEVPKWDYAFAYGSFINDQLKVSIGKLGDSPWEAGGPEMWHILDNRIGIRFEIKPNILQGLNIGFVLNDRDGQPSQGIETQSLLGTLQESVIGIGYENDYFLGRFAYRLDGIDDWEAGDKFLYRLEEKAIQKYLTGFQIWANGYFEGLRTSEVENWSGTNWLYVQYAPEWFTAQVRFGLDLIEGRQTFYARPSFYYNLFNKLIEVGVAFEFAQDSGEGKLYADSQFLRWYVEPQVRVNLHANAYLSFIYQHRNQYTEAGKDTLTKVNMVNLRAVYTF